MAVKNAEPIVLEITRCEKSLTEDPLFANIRSKALKVLERNKPKQDMDSVFFNEDRFELMVDTRGYKPEEVKCTVSPVVVEIRAERQELSSTSNRSVSTTRSYQLPQNVLPQQTVCCLSPEGILLVAAPWQK